MTDGLGGKLFPMEAGGPMQGICRVNEWADVHEYSVDGWAKVVVYKVGTWYHIHRWAQTDIKLEGWAEGIIKYRIRWVGRECFKKYFFGRVGQGYCTGYCIRRLG
jgi:hypothetical protein